MQIQFNKGPSVMYSAERFLRLLDPTTSNFCFQIIRNRDKTEIPTGQSAAPGSWRYGTLKQVMPWLEKVNKTEDGGYCGVYVVINETDGKGRKASNIVRVRSLFVELDHGGLTSDHMQEFLEAFKPSMLVQSSPGKWHCYWLLTDDSIIDLEKFSSLQQLLVYKFRTLKSGSESIDLPRVLRLPGFKNLKDGMDFEVELFYPQGDAAAPRYTIDEIFTNLGITEEYVAEWLATLEKSGGVASHASAVAPGVEGRGIYVGAEAGNRNEVLYNYALQHLFKHRGLNFDEGLAAAWIANRKNVPPLEAEEVETIVRSAWKYFIDSGVIPPPPPGIAEEVFDTWTAGVKNNNSVSTAGDSIPDPDGSEDFESRNFVYNYNTNGMACAVSDTSLAERMFQKYGDIIRHNSIYGFYIYDTLAWRNLETGLSMLHTLMRDTFTTVPNEPEVLNYGLSAVAWDSFRRYVHSSGAFKAVTNLLACRQELKCSPGDFYKESDSDFIACQNGVVSLLKNKLVPSNPNFGFTDTINCEFDPDAKCPQWEHFINSCMSGDLEQIEYVQRITGYLLSGRTDLQCLFVIFGKPGTGKSVYLSVLTELLGSMAIELNPHVLIADKGSENAKAASLAKAIGCRLATIQETSASECWAEDVIKAVTGGDMISAKPSHKDPITFRPRFKLCVRANAIPSTKQVDEGMWERLVFVPFERKFRGQSDEIRGLDRLLKRELPGILNWGMKGYQQLASYGFDLRAPAAARDQKSQSMRDAEPIRDFIESYCELCDATTGLSVTEFDIKFQAFCRSEGLVYNLGKRGTKGILRQLGVTDRVIRTNNEVLRRYNVRIKESLINELTPKSNVIEFPTK